MFKHRRVRVTCVLMVGWAFFTVVERQSERATWSESLLHALVWALAVAGTWWFAEMTQLGPRTARPVASASTTNSSRRSGISATGRQAEDDDRQSEGRRGGDDDRQAWEPAAGRAQE
ncbi:hypothetical protein [Streptomyces sp. NPDC003401]